MEEGRWKPLKMFSRHCYSTGGNLLHKIKLYGTRMAKIQGPKEGKTYSNIYKEEGTQPWPMGSEIYPEVHENPRAFFRKDLISNPEVLPTMGSFPRHRLPVGLDLLFAATIPLLPNMFPCYVARWDETNKNPLYAHRGESHLPSVGTQR